MRAGDGDERVLVCVIVVFVHELANEVPQEYKQHKHHITWDGDMSGSAEERPLIQR